MLRPAAIAALAWFLVGAQAPAPVQMQGYQVVATYPHDPRAYTQGLFIRDGQLYESTGREGQSTIRIVRLKDGKVLKSAALPPDQFGEGSTDWGNEIVSLTWTDGIGYRWDRKTLKRKGSFRYGGEGWGLTHDGKRLILSDGTPTLRFVDPRTFAETGRVRVTLDGKPLAQLNEIEWVEGEVYANIWQTDYVARIDPVTGRVKALIDLAALDGGPNEDGVDNVLNGIAYDAKAKRLFVTGKNWSRLFEIKLKPN
jgi:glutaminyl-peptide cyclotransferase